MFDEITVSEETVLCAFEYAIGRKSYVVGNVVRDILENAESLSSQTRKTMADKINQKWSADELGHASDRSQWLGLLRQLKEIEAENG